jgi:hypothetical protein
MWRRNEEQAPPHGTWGRSIPELGIPVESRQNRGAARRGLQRNLILKRHPIYTQKLASAA